LEKDVLAKKMLDCIDMINEVLKSNISMREQVKNYAIALDQQKTNFLRVKLENERLRTDAERTTRSRREERENPYQTLPAE